MPRVKFDYVVSFSSEDPDNQANNLLATEISKKKWLCGKGEPSCSVVLQMNKAVKISAVHIGAYQASLVEVLVGRSETPNEPYQVLVASNVFLSPTESRREQSVERVRSFTADQLSSPARDQRWDRLRIVCSQPYNKHCKYGLSFVHVFEPEGAEGREGREASRCPALPSRLLNLDTFSSDEDEFRPGELFAKHLESSQDNGTGISNTTEVQIRQATSQALRNLSDSATKLKKTSLPKPTKRSNVDSDQSDTKNRHRESLLYEDGDEKPNDKVGRDTHRHSHNNIKHELANVNKTTLKENKMNNTIDLELNVKKQDRDKNTGHKHKPTATQAAHKHGDQTISADGERRGRAGDTRKRTHSDMKQKQDRNRGAADRVEGAVRAGPVSSAPHELLRHVVLVLSGYVNPERARLRTTALALGATCRPHWDATCTHLICAFPNTPKLKEVRAGVGGGAVPVARGDWLEQCAARRRLLPWQWFATEDSRRVAPDQLDHTDDEQQIGVNSECDTDDELEKVLQKQKKQRFDKSPQQKHSAGREQPRDRSRDQSRDQAARDDRSHRDEEEGARTEPDTDAEDNLQIDESRALPDFFDGLRFVVARDATERGDVTRQVERYVRAYGGLLLDVSMPAPASAHLIHPIDLNLNQDCLQEIQASEDCEPDYVVCVSGAVGAAVWAGRGGGATRAVRPDWLWKCHSEQKLCPHDEYTYA